MERLKENNDPYWNFRLTLYGDTDDKGEYRRRIHDALLDEFADLGLIAVRVI
ncbi:hypothetical protein MYX06_00870 [Patescibacteria group bacterium AH-259-L05]|nr:hypothetical protein [Patescibacteria group bacterium AH-259-L05]